ncbi:hypothetical protein EK904_006098 [Melospiza melodia maxima]|nr:hypothetical protein EK904_006098 [Melospiza melodia maxima]
MLQDWLSEFRKSTSSSSTANPEELVAFDVLCGDLNFDNCSSEDKLEQQHSLFTHYKDPCRVGPGEDKPWAIGKSSPALRVGMNASLLPPTACPEQLLLLLQLTSSKGTLLDPEGLYDEEVCTPDNLQKVLESEEGRKGYLVYPTSKNHGSSQKGRKASLKGNGRRIDYMLYTEEGLYLEWKVEVEEFSFITQLAGLTDHLPVAMRLMPVTVVVRARSSRMRPHCMHGRNRAEEPGSRQGRAQSRPSQSLLGLETLLSVQVDLKPNNSLQFADRLHFTTALLEQVNKRPKEDSRKPSISRSFEGVRS